MTDINERMVDEWVESTTARERIKEILEETTTYSKVSAIADRARVSEPTTRKYLNELVEEDRHHRTGRPYYPVQTQSRSTRR